MPGGTGKYRHDNAFYGHGNKFILLEKNKLQRWMVWGLLGGVIGYSLLIFAPGNYVRLQGNINRVQYDFIQDNVIGGVKTIRKLILRQWPIYLLGFVLIRHILRYKKVKDAYSWDLWLGNNRKLLWSSAAYIFFSQITILVMFISPEFPERAGMGAAVFLIIGVIQLLRLDLYREFIFKNTVFISGTMTILWLISAVWTAHCYLDYQNEHQMRMTLIAEAKAEGGIKDIVFSPFSMQRDGYLDVKRGFPLGFIAEFDLTKDPQSFYNVRFSRYFGINSVRVIDE